MNLRKLLLFTFLFTLGQASVLAQSGNPGDAKQKAHEAMIAAKESFDLIDYQVKAMQGRRAIPGRDHTGRGLTLVPVVPESMLQRREEAWARFQQATAAYRQLKGTSANNANAYKDVEQIREAVQTHARHPDKFLHWLEAQNVDINHEEVRTNLLTLIKSNKVPADVLRMLIHYGPRASSYRDELLALAKSEPLKKKGGAIRILLVAAIVNIDTSTKQELTQITKNWLSEQYFISERRSLLQALAGEKDPFSHRDQRSGKKSGEK